LNVLEWCSKRFFEFRIGNKQYIGLTIALLNFVLIFQRFFIDMIDSIHQIISNIVIFGILFFIVYIPLAVVIGKWHYSNQHRIDKTFEFFKDSGDIKFFKLFFDLKTNSADLEKVELFKKMLTKFEKQSRTDFLK